MRLDEESIKFVNHIMGHDDCYDDIADDLTPDKHRYHLGHFFLHNESIYVLNPNENTLFILVPESSTLFKVHTCILSAGRGKQGVDAGKEAISWMFKNSPATCLMSYIPSYNRKAGAFAWSCNFKKTGEVADSWAKNGVLYSQKIYSLEKERWSLCQQHQQ